MLPVEGERAGVDLLIFGRDGSQGKREEIHSEEEENRIDPSSELWRKSCLE